MKNHRTYLSDFTIIKSITISFMYVSQLKKNISYFSHIYFFCVSWLKKNLIIFLCSHTQTHTHTNYLSKRWKHFAFSILFSFPCTALFCLSFFSLSGFLLAAILTLLCNLLFLYFLFNMRHNVLLMRHTLIATIYLMQHINPCFYKQVCRHT